MPHPHTLTTDLVAARQRARDDYVDTLRNTYPKPDDPIRRRAEAELDSWWPGTMHRLDVVGLEDGPAGVYRPRRREVSP